MMLGSCRAGDIVDARQFGRRRVQCPGREVANIYVLRGGIIAFWGKDFTASLRPHRPIGKAVGGVMGSDDEPRTNDEAAGAIDFLHNILAMGFEWAIGFIGDCCAVGVIKAFHGRIFIGIRGREIGIDGDGRDK